jgi:MFS family permease
LVASLRSERALAGSNPGYLIVATLVRLADGGSSVALVTVALSLPGRTTVASGGLLTALLAAPHLFGPLAAVPLTRAHDPRRVLAVAFASFGVALTACGLLLAHGVFVLAAVSAIVAGCSGPLLTGGLSTWAAAGRSGPAPGERRNRDGGDVRRAEAWDAATYGVGSTLGPSVVAGVIALASPVVAVAALGGAAVLASALALRLPSRPERQELAREPLRRVLAAIVAVPPLRRTLIATTLGALGTGGLLVAAVVFGTRLSGHESTGALLAAAYGAGNLGGSLSLIVRPTRGEPEARTVTLLGVGAVLIALCAASPDTTIAVACFAVTGMAAAAQFTASLGVRSRYAPPGTRTHVFVTMAGLKVACASLGAALASSALVFGPRAVLLMISALALTGSVVATLMRIRSRRSPQVACVQGAEIE